MLVRENSFKHQGKSLVIWEFLVGDKIYVTTPCNKHIFGSTFREADIHNKHIKPMHWLSKNE